MQPLDDDQDRAWQGLLTVVHRAFPEIARTLRPHELLPIQYGILITLARAPGQTLRLGQLAEETDTIPSHITHRLRDLVARGEVVLADDPDDGRGRNATLTAAGSARLDAATPDHLTDLHRLLFDHLNPSQTAALADALDTVADALRD